MTVPVSASPDSTGLHYLDRPTVPTRSEDTAWSEPAPTTGRRDGLTQPPDRGGRALSTVGLVTAVANGGLSTAYEIHRHQNRSNSLAATGGKASAGTPNLFRTRLVGQLKQTNGTMTTLKGENAPFQAFLRGQGKLDAKQISSTLTQEKHYWQTDIADNESAARSHRSQASSLESQAFWATDTKNHEGKVIESASSKRWRLESEASSHRSSAARCDENAILGRARLKDVNAYISGKRRDPEVLETAVTRRVTTTKAKIATLEDEASSLSTRITREPFRETTFQKGGRIAIGVLSTAGAAIEGYNAYRSFTEGKDVAGCLHMTAAVGHGILASGTFMRSPSGAISGAVLSTLGSIGAQIAEQD